MPIIWQSLLINLAIIAVLILVWELFTDAIGDFTKSLRRAFLGVIMGLGAVTSMVVAVPTETGQIFDLRTASIISTGFIGGPLAGAIAALFSAAARFMIGGAGTVPGLVSIVIAYCGALAAFLLFRPNPKFWQIAIVSLVVPVLGLAAYFFVPVAVRGDLFRSTALPFTLMTAVATMLASSVLVRVELRRLLLSRNQAYATMVENLPDCLNLKDLNGRFLIANTATADLMKAGSARELIGKTDFDYYPADLARQFRDEEKAILAAGEPMKIEQQFVNRGGEKGWLATLKAPLYDDKGDLVGLITHNREVSSEKRAAEVKNQFVSTVSHELRTPLTAIRGAMGLLAGGVLTDVPPKARKLIDIAQSNSERLVELINDILDMERIELGKMDLELQARPLRPVIDQTVIDLENYLPDRDVKIVVDDRAPGETAWIDERRMKQVLTNLISNAVKFSDAGSVVTVRLDRVETSQRLRLSVHNTGNPIPDAFKSRIFQKFERNEEGTAQQQGGTGLGLAIALSLVRHMKGDIWFESSAATGTTFHVDLVEADAAQIVPTPEPTSAPVPDARPQQKVLLIEHDAAASTLMTDALTAAEFATVAVSSLEEARAAVAADRFKAVLLDLDLVSEDIELMFSDLQRQDPQQLIIVIAAEADEQQRSMIGRTLPIADWISKPVEAQRVLESVRAIRERRSDSKPRVLHVEDDKDIVTLIRDQFEDDVEVWHAETLSEAEALVARMQFDVVILDISLPDGSGLELLPRLDDNTSIVVFSAVEMDLKPGGQIQSVMTKTRTAEVDVVTAVRRQLGQIAETAA